MDKPVTVAVDARALQRPGVGFYTVLDAMLSELVDPAFETILVTDSEEHAAALRGQRPGPEVVTLTRTNWVRWEQVQLAAFLRRRRPDVWVAPTNYGIPLAAPAGVGSVLIVHDLIPLLHPRTYLTPRPVWAGLYLIALASALLRAGELIVVSDRTARDVRRWSRRPATVIHPPIPARLMEEPARPDVAGPYVLFNGGFEQRKNFPVVLDAFARFADTAEGRGASLVVLGDRRDIAEPMIDAAGLADRALVTGYVTDEQKWSYLAHATAVLYPSSFEGFGVVVVEGFAAGVPVVTGTGGALAEVAGSAALTVDPGDVSAVVAALRLCTDEAVRDRLREAGAARLETLRARSGGYAGVVRRAAGR